MARGASSWRQKGTGRARVGSICSQSSVAQGRHRSTARSRAPTRSRSLSVREKKNALKSALSRKLADEQIVMILENLELESHKTKEP